MVYSWKVLLFLIVIIATTSNQIIHVNAQTLQSPLKQLESGIKVQDIKCKESFILVVKESNGNPSCVHSASVTRLLIHGWITIEKFETIHPVIQQKIETPIPKNTNTTPNSVITNETNATNQTVTNATSLVIEDIIRNLPSQRSDSVTISPFGNGLIWINVDISKFTGNKTLYYPTFIPLHEVTANPTIISSTLPNYIKILSVGMFPYPLKVGDTPEFTLTYQNISKKPITHPLTNCVALWFDYSILPQDMVTEDIFRENPLILNGSCEKDLQPNQIVTDAGLGFPSPIDPSVNTWRSPVHAHYQITKSGMLTVTMKMRLGVGLEDLSETIQFNVNATR